jgi:uncharacterized integral membrane protein
MAQRSGKGNAILKLKVVVVLILLIVVSILVFQNTDSVETKLLFTTVTMPRALLLFTTAILGFVAGILVAVSLSRKRQAR